MSEIRYPAMVVDVHTHVFNAKHLPIQGILLRGLQVEDGDGKPVRRWFARRLRDLIVGVTSSVAQGSIFSPLTRTGVEDISGDHSPQELTEALYLRIVEAIDRELDLRRSDTAPLSSATLTTVQNALEESSTAVAAAEVEWMFRNSDVFDTEETLDARVLQIPHEAITAVATQKLAIARTSGTASGLSLLTNPALAWLIGKVADWMVRWLLDDGLDLLKFIHLMISAESENVRSILASYAPSQNVTSLVHMQLDMEWAYPTADDDPAYDVPTQWRRLQALADGQSETIRWFAGFDPRGTSRDAVVAYCEAARAAGCTGFKFYPPMGYRPAGNTDTAIEASCDTFFAYCASNSVPVFSHCTPQGFQAREYSGLNGDPAYWAIALERHPTLRLCLGHAGGGRVENARVTSKGWVAEGGEWGSAENWARNVVALCQTYEHVYCEFGHLDALIGPNEHERRAFERNFIGALTSTDGRFRFSTKAMFGSDSVMPDMVRHTEDFLEAFRRLFESQGLGQPLFDGFVAGNAERFLSPASA